MIEKKIIHKRIYGGLSFCQLSKDEKLLAADEIIIQCVSICGCQLHQSEKLSETLTESLSHFINDFGYENLTIAEIILALQINNAPDLKFPSGLEIEHIPFIGYYANVSYIAKVLHNYTTIRNLLDRKFQNQIDGYE